MINVELFLAYVCITAVIFFIYKRRRDRKIRKLSELMDRILHGEEGVSIEECEEGEIAILASEIQKMTIRLKEQSDALLQDKKNLADAIYDISHQLRTPLTSMNLVVELLSKEELDYEHRLKLNRELKYSLARIDWLIEALLKLSKIDAKTALFVHEEVSVRELVEKSVEPFMVSMELKDITLDMKVDEEKYIGDLQWSREAIGNLIKNCVEHTNIGGNICISAEENPLYTEIRVSDDGDGFCQEDIPYLFNRFYKGKNASEHSIGIGLALARSVILEQNGTIKASNRMDNTGAVRGATFEVRFYKSVI